VRHDEENARIAAEISGLARSTSRTVGVAESLTGGAVCAAESSSEWFRGGLVAYSSEVKHAVLDVPDGPVVSAEAAHAPSSMPTWHWA
jgi:nicotinamide-nucleotide amidase